MSDNWDKTKSYRNWCVTLNNYTEAECELFCNFECKYIIVGKEVGEQGTPHLQGYIEMKNPKTVSALNKLLGNRCWLQPSKYSSEANINYCSKEGNELVKRGTASAQGTRTDLKKITDDIMNGEVTVDDLALDRPDLYHQYARTFSKVEDLRMRKLYRTEMTEGIWYWGATGVGKSHLAYEGFTPDTHYNWKYDNGWQDGYVQQETVIINEFRGQIQYSELLTLVDKWPTELRRRAREPMPFISKKVIITSSLPPAEVYRNLSQHDDLEQLLRRFKVIEIKKT